jgi:hypothetical protein
MPAATKQLPRFFLAITAFFGPLFFQLATKPLPRKPAIPSAARLCGFSQGDAISTENNFFEKFLAKIEQFQKFLQLFIRVSFSRKLPKKVLFVGFADPERWKFMKGE